MLIRVEERQDWPAVYAVNVSAFKSPVEAALVDALRNQACPLVSLVAEDAGAIAGHIMFSPVSLPDHPALKIMGLAPMAVASQHQRKGIGSALVSRGLKAMQATRFRRCRCPGASPILSTIRILAGCPLRHQLRI